MPELLAAYQDPMFLWFPVLGNLVSMGSFLAFALPLSWVAWREPAWARPWRIQAKRPDVDTWFWPGMRSWLVNNAILIALIVATWPLWHGLVRVHLGPLPAWWVIALQLVCFIYVDDALYYVMHRAMHRGWLYKRIHSVHHRILRPHAMTGHYMHPVEFISTATLMLVMPLLLGVHVVVLYLWIVWRQLEAAEGHCGYHVPFSPTCWIPGGHGADFHDFHHAKFHGNYAGFLSHVDRWMGTYSKGYAAHHEARRQGRASHDVAPS